MKYTIQLNYIKNCIVEVRTLKSHPEYDVLYVTSLDGTTLSVLCATGPVDFDLYDGHLLVGNYLTENNKDNFIPRSI